MKRLQHLENLDGLRFLGALSVFIFHAFSINREVWGEFYDSGIFPILRKLTSIGHYGVNLFFVLSGFLITYLLLEELKRNGKIQIWFFLTRRILRLWPLYFALILFGFFIFPHLPFGITTVHEFWRYALFLSNFDEIIHGANDSLNFLTATWSVSVEEQFYVTWAFIIGFFRLKTKQAFQVFFISAILISILFRWYFASDERIMYYHTLAVISDMALGGLLATQIGDRLTTPSNQRLKEFQILAIYLLGIAFLYVSPKLLLGKLFVLERLISGSFFMFIIWEQLRCSHSFFKADRIPFFKQGGKITYGFYLYHSLLIYYFAHLFQQFNWNNSALYFMLYFVLLLLSNWFISILSYRYFEEPILRLKDKFRV